ncbi:hypothetical protein [Planomonospora venezuelensis]|nr:hypothetical protein [Planomonospora venezuelensis]
MAVAVIVGVVAVALRALDRCQSEQVSTVLTSLTRFTAVLLRSRHTK